MKYDRKKIAKFLTKDFLIKECINKKKSILKLAKEIDCNFSTIYYRLQKYNIKIREEVSNKLYEAVLTKVFLVKNYLVNKKSACRIAKEVGCSHDTIYEYLKNSNIKIRNRSEARTGKLSPFYGKTPTKETRILMAKAKIGTQNALIDGRTFKTYYCIKEGCNNVISYVNWRIGKGRCNKCYGKSVSGINSPHWINGSSRRGYSLDFNKELKHIIFKRDIFTCQICNVYGGDLNCHHIDYDRQNSDKNNLITLCRSCHCKTNFNRDYWKQYFKNKTEVIKNEILI